jgi:hypothetical protein
MDYCQIFEEDVEHTPARFFPIADQTTPTWSEKIQALEDVERQLPDSILPFTVKYLHALDSLYEDQHRELKRWIKKAKKAEAETRKLRLETLVLNSRVATMRKERQRYMQKLHEVLDHPRYKKNAKEINNRKRTFALPPEQGIRIPGIYLRGKAQAVPAYDLENPILNHVESEESVADNFDNMKATKDAMTTGPSQISPGQGADDGYVNDLYAL